MYTDEKWTKTRQNDKHKKKESVHEKRGTERAQRAPNKESAENLVC